MYNFRNALEPDSIKSIHILLISVKNFHQRMHGKMQRDYYRGMISQGYYIYRANRLIRVGGWHGTKAKDEHDKLARISIDIDPELDDFSQNYC